MRKNIPHLVWALSLLAACAPKKSNISAPVTYTVAGTVVNSPCGGVQGASVSVLTEADTVTAGLAAQDDGSFQLTGLSDGVVLEVTGEGFVPTLSRRIRLNADRNDFELAAIDNTVATSVHLLAGFDWTLRGTVVVAVGNENELPILGAEVTLLDSNGKEVGTRRYVGANDTWTGLALQEQGGTPKGLGAALFFGVPDGTYTVSVVHSSYDFPTDIEMVARTGKISVARALGALRTDATASVDEVVITGTVAKHGLLPQWGGGSSLEGMEIQAYSDGEIFTTTTNAKGEYRFSLPFVRRLVDITVGMKENGYAPERTHMFCAETGSRWAGHITLQDSFFLRQKQRRAAGTTPIDPQSGYIVASTAQYVTDAWQYGLQGATIALSPGTHEPFYGEVQGVVGSCAVSECGTGCGAGTRCQANECVLGEEAASQNLCTRCGDGNVCPDGFLPKELLSVSDGSACYCLPARPGITTSSDDDCTLSCPMGTYCLSPLQRTNEGLYEPQESYCHPYAPLLKNTESNAQVGGYSAGFANLPEGVYILDGTYDGAVARRNIKVRVSPGVIVRTIVDF